MTEVAIRRLAHGEGLALPAYETEHAAGMDLRAAEEAVVEVEDRVGEDHLAVVIGIQGVLAWHLRGRSKEEVVQGVDGVGDVVVAVAVCIAPAENRGRRQARLAINGQAGHFLVAGRDLQAGLAIASLERLVGARPPQGGALTEKSLVHRGSGRGARRRLPRPFMWCSVRTRPAPSRSSAARWRN